MSNFLKWLAEFLGNIRGGSSSVVGRWNPIPIGMYADLIIQQMGATPAQIQKHIERVIGPEVEKDIPFIYIPDIDGDPTKGNFIDKTTGQIYTSEQWYKIGPIYTALKKGEITEDEAYEQIGQVPDITGQSPTTEQKEDENEVVDVADDDTTEELLADTTDSDGDGILDINDVRPDDPNIQTQAQLDAIEEKRLADEAEAQRLADIEEKRLADEAEAQRLADIEEKRLADLAEWNAGDADNDGVLNEFDNNDFSINAFVGGSDVDTDNDGVPDSLDPFPNDPNRNSITEVGAFEIKWTTKDGRIIKIPIWGGEKAREGLNAKIDADGNIKVSVGVNMDGVIIEKELGSPEEIGNKINDAINSGKTTVEEVTEDIVNVWDLIFGTKKKDDEDDGEEETVLVDNDGDGVYSDVDYDDDDYDVQTKDQVSGGKAVLPALGGDDSQEPVGTIVSPPTSTIEDPVKSILDTTDSKKPNDKINIKDSDRTNYSSKLATESGKKQEDTVEAGETGETTTSIEGQDPYEDIIETETSIAAGLGGGGLFQGTTAEALGRFMPKEIVQPVPFARRAAVYQRPRYSLFSEYI